MTSRKEILKKLVKELYKHADKDNCFGCKQLIRDLGLDPDKNIDEVLNPKEETTRN